MNLVIVVWLATTVASLMSFIGRKSLKNSGSNIIRVWIEIPGVVISVGLQKELSANLLKLNSEHNRKGEMTVVGYIASKKLGTIRKALGICLGLSVVYLVLEHLSVPDIAYRTVGFILLALTIFLWAYVYVLGYRIRMGFYGSNENEMRELVSFVLQHSKDDFFNGQGFKKIFDERVEEEDYSVKELGWEGLHD